MRISRYFVFAATATAIVAAFSSAAAQNAASGTLRAAALRCEHLTNPSAVHVRRPRLTWTVSSERRGDRQTAYQVLVAGSPEALARDDGDRWDSGKVASSQTAHITYGGAPLASRARCWWKVRVWDRDGTVGPWSPVARWEMGLLSPDDWVAHWIEAPRVPATCELLEATYETLDGHVRKDVADRVRQQLSESDGGVVASNEALGGDPAVNVKKQLRIRYRCDGTELTEIVPEGARVTLAAGRIPYLRTSFELRGKVRTARLYATALGVYELHLNGRRVGDQFLAPGWTDYRRRVRYQVYDVTDQLAEGRNALGAIVAPGWFAGHAGLFNAHRFYGAVPALLAQLEITFEDGRTQRIVTDDTWKSRAGPLLQADLLKGETFDAPSAIAGWNSPDFDDRDWDTVTVRAESRQLEPDISEPVRVLKEIPARSLSEPQPGRWTFDLGQNMVGVVRLRVQAEPGTVITLRHGEVLNPDGTIYTQNLRAATSTDRYVCGGGVETWQPRFTFHGFRYVELTGLTGKPPLAAVTGVVLGSDMPRAGRFECSDERIYRLQQNIEWGLRGNYLSIPTDCPQRDERMGWMADAQVFVPTAVYNADIAAFMNKWLVDVVDAQRADGAYSDVAPAMSGLSYGTPAWADAGVIVPWELYEAYGDPRFLERNIDAMMRWVDWCRENSDGLIRSKARGNDYGDWLSIGADTSKELIGTAYFARSADLVSRSLRVLGRDEEAERYARLFAEIRAAFQRKYVPPGGRVLGDTQTAYLLALTFDLLDEADRPRVFERLVADIEAKDWHLSTGFLGVGLLLPALSDHGRTDVAYRLLLRDSMPSWLFPVRHGATTIWERWDGWTPQGGVHPDFGMNSFNHYALGSCGRWLFEGVAGISRAPGVPGFERIIVRPRVGEGLEWARAEFRSIRGPVRSAWRTEDGAFHLDLSIPANVTAEVWLPSSEPANVREGGVPAQSAAGVRFLRPAGAESVWEVGSGDYRFVARPAGGEPGRDAGNSDD